MIDAAYRGNIEELLSVINHLKKYLIVFVIVLLILLSIFHFSKYSVNIIPLITVTLVLLPAVYYATVLILKFGSSVIASTQTGEATTMSADDNGQALKTPDQPYPKCPTPPPSYEEATRNDGYYQHQPQPWLPSTSSGGGGHTGGPSPPAVFDVQRQYIASASNVQRPLAVVGATLQNQPIGDRTPPPKPTTIPKIPSVTITLDDVDQRTMEI